MHQLASISGVRIVPNSYLSATLSTASSENNDSGCVQESRTELESYANMPVVGKYCTILTETGRTVDVSAYSPDYPVHELPVVDAAIRYDDPYDGGIHYFIIRNALHVPSMKNNLIPPFIMREAGIAVNDTPKIHLWDPGVENHSL